MAVPVLSFGSSPRAGWEVKRPKALDLFCGAGGAAMGLHRAGFDVVGIDIKPQKHYPFAFVQADALQPPVRLADFDLIWASPPCQAHSTIGKQNRTRRNYDHPDLVPGTRALLEPHPTWVIENVMGATLAACVVLCGSQFGLDVKRHRQFESSFAIMQLPCNHRNWRGQYRSSDKRRAGKPARVVGVHGHLNYSGERQLRERAMGIDWMDDRGLSQAIPPAYSEHIGRYAMMALGLDPDEYARGKE